MFGKGNASTASRNPTRGEIAIQELVNRDFKPQLLRQRAAQLLNSKQLLRNVLGLALENQAKFVEKVDEIYPTIDSQNVKSVTALGNVCSAIERLPTSAVLSEGLNKQGDIAVASGGSTDIWQGDHRGEQVAIKAFRIHPAQKLREAKEILWKRVPTWRKFSHENVLPFRGVNTTLFQLALVYDWEQHGNINQYLESHPEASRPHLLLDVAKGLKYLHSLDIPHGNLKGANVVIDQSAHARLTEYGLTPINSGPSFTAGATPGAVESSRWSAPEIINPPRKGDSMPVESKSADVFAFAMLSVEVFTGKKPFDDRKNEAVVVSILRGTRPEMPKDAQAVGLTGEMWNLLESCWQKDPEKRPTMEEVVRRWQEFVGHNNDGNNVVNKKPPMPEYAPDTGQPRARSDAARPQTKPEAPRFRKTSETAHSRTSLEGIHRRRTPEAIQPPTKPEVPRIRTTSGTVRLQTTSETFSFRAGFVQHGTLSEVTESQTEPKTPPPTPKRWKKWFCGLF